MTDYCVSYNMIGAAYREIVEGLIPSCSKQRWCFIDDHYVLFFYTSWINFSTCFLIWMIWRWPTSQSKTGSSVCSNQVVLLVVQVQSVSVKLQWHLTTIISATLQRHPFSFLQDYSGTNSTSVSCWKSQLDQYVRHSPSVTFCTHIPAPWQNHPSRTN